MILLFVLMVTSLLFASPLPVVVQAIYPNQIRLKWAPVPSADYYDVYLDGKPWQRTEGSEIQVGSNENPLLSHHRYILIIAARQKGNIELASTALGFLTPGWEGHYRWKNQTTENNDGKCLQLDFLVSWKDGSYTIHGLYDKPRLLYPMIEREQIGMQFLYEGESEVQVAYRTNAEIFNTTGFTPKTWKVKEILEEGDTLKIKVETKVGPVSATTTTTYLFRMTDEGVKQLWFETKGSGLASWGMFSSPNPGDDGVFKSAVIEK